IDRIHLQLPFPSEGEHPFGQRGATFRSLEGVVDQRRDSGIGLNALADKLEAADNRRQKIIEIVSHAASKLADGFHLLGLKQSFTNLLELAGLFEPIRYITGDFGEADHLALLI